MRFYRIPNVKGGSGFGSWVMVLGTNFMNPVEGNLAFFLCFAQRLPEKVKLVLYGQMFGWHDLLHEKSQFALHTLKAFLDGYFLQLRSPFPHQFVFIPNGRPVRMNSLIRIRLDLVVEMLEV